MRFDLKLFVGLTKIEIKGIIYQDTKGKKIRGGA